MEISRMLKFCSTQVRCEWTSRRKTAAPHLSHGVGHSSCLWRLVLHLPPKRYSIAGHDGSTASPSSSSSSVYIWTTSHHCGPDPVGDPGPGPAQGHGAFGQRGIQPAAQAPNADRVISCVGEVHGPAGGVGSIKRLDILHGQGFTGAGQAPSGAAAAVSPVAEARRAREAWGAAGTPRHRPVSVGSDDIQLRDGTRATVHCEIICGVYWRDRRVSGSNE